MEIIFFFLFQFNHFYYILRVDYVFFLNFFVQTDKVNKRTTHESIF